MHAWILADGRLDYTTEVALVRRAHEQGQRLWMDLDVQTPELNELLIQTFKIHPLVIEDMWLERSVPKIEDFDKGNYLYLVVYGVRRGSTASRLDLYALDIIFGETFVITQHSRPLTVDEELKPYTPMLEKGPPWLVHGLLDRLVDQYLPVIAEVGSQSDRMELDVLRGEVPDDAVLLPQIHDLKRGLKKLCRISGYQKDLLRRLSQGAYDDVPREVLPYLRDVHDHFTRVADDVETYRDVVDNIMDTFLSLQSNRMNATMKTLATISTLMLPLSFIASLYGMNFRYMPELEWRWGYPYVLTLMVVVATSLMVWFKRRHWL